MSELTHVLVCGRGYWGRGAAMLLGAGGVLAGAAVGIVLHYRAGPLADLPKA